MSTPHSRNDPQVATSEHQLPAPGDVLRGETNPPINSALAPEFKPSAECGNNDNGNLPIGFAHAMHRPEIGMLRTLLDDLEPIPGTTELSNSINHYLKHINTPRPDEERADQLISLCERGLQEIPTDHDLEPFLLSYLWGLRWKRFNISGGLEDLNKLIEYDHRVLALTSEGPRGKSERLANLGVLYERRFTLLGEEPDIDKSLDCKVQALALTPDGHPAKLTRLHNLGTAYHGRFERFKSRSDIDKAVDCLSRLVQLTPADHPNKPRCLNNLAIVYQTRFQQWDDLEELQKSIECDTQAISIAPDGHPDLPGWWSSLGISHIYRFQRTGDPVDGQRAVDALTQATLLAPDDTIRKPGYLGNLGTAYHRRFERLGDVFDLDKAIESYAQASSLVPDDAPNNPGILNNLGGVYRARFERSGSLLDLDRAIDYHSRATALTPKGDVNKYASSQKLGNLYRSRFKHTGNLVDIDKAMSYLFEATALVPDGLATKWACLRDLGGSYVTRFERLGDDSDIQKAIEYLTGAATLASDNPKDESQCMNDLGTAFQRRFKRFDNIADITRAVEYLIQAVQLTPDGNPEKSKRLSNLGVSYQDKFERLGDLGDLNLAVKHNAEAARLTLENDTDKPRTLSNLSVAYMSRFQRQGQVSDIDRGIDCLFQALTLAAEGDEQRQGYLTNLGLSYFYRFDRLGELADIDKAIEYQSQALEITPGDHPDRPSRQSNLGVCYQFRYERLRDISDITVAIEYQTRALCDVQARDAGEKMRLNNLGNSYYCRFDHQRNPDDLNKAINYLTRAIELTPDDHVLKPWWLNNLSLPYHSRFQGQGNRGDIDQAIEYQDRAVALTPDGYAYRPQLLETLGTLYRARWEGLGQHEDLDLAINSFKAAAISLGHAPTRLKAARCWARLCSRHKRSPIEAYRTALELIPQVVWLGVSVNRRYQYLTSDVQGIAIEAAAAAIEQQEHTLALEWLQEGRSIVWNQMLQLRTPFEELLPVDPDLAHHLRRVAIELEETSALIPNKYMELLTGHALERVSQEHRHLANEWDKLLGRARNIPGLHGFLKPKKFTDLALSARSGAVVIINVHQERCDALALLPHSKNLVHIPLPLFSYDKATELRDKISSVQDTRIRSCDLRRPVFPDFSLQEYLEETLNVLWSDVVRPILHRLGYIVARHSIAELPHITWCATGPLTFLPLHAAGYYDKPRERVFDYIISSYTPNLGALLRSTHINSDFRGILAVGEAATKSKAPLAGTVTELNRLEEQAQGLPFTRIDEQHATCDAVLSAMEKHSWVHLACHAAQNISDPTKSALQLHDSLLSLAAITSKSLKHVEFAFLSACETATGDAKLPDEAIHLAAGMIMIGYPTVVATMWSIKDQDAPFIAERVYGQLLDGGKPHSYKAARALHEALVGLRNTIGEKDFARWVPYIHLGSTAEVAATGHQRLRPGKL
ncbi:hypothetical protein FRC08_002492 [Ceratobasidium sp. 394]|nr:hypothetical protein FRC08_002492 [Ceratobasidium sp. 394]